MPRMSLRGAAAFLRALPVRWEKEITAEETRTAEDAVETAQRWSSGPLTRRDLRRMGHPYARRAPSGSVDPGLINDGGGEFRQRWASLPPQVAGGRMRSGARNTSDHARYMRGTTRMVVRPIDRRVIEEITPRRRDRLTAARRRALYG